MNNRVLVMMSTYNGEKYLREQIDSIINQKDVEVDLLIRDDGSKDNTISILKEYQQSYGNIQFYSGENLKPAKSFLDLIKKADLSYDYYAFSDQDDVWSEYKLINGIKKILENDSHIPILHFCESDIVDENLNKIEETNRNIDIENDKITQMISLGSIEGCMMLLNWNLMNELKKYFPNNIVMHDKWIQLICLLNGGKIVKSQERYIKHRRIPNKSVTGKRGILARFKKLMNLIMTNEKCMYSLELKELLENYQVCLDAEEKMLGVQIVNYKTNWKHRMKLLCLKNKFISKSEMRNLKLRIFLGIF